MNEKKFDFWRDHSLHFLEMAFGYDRRERLQNPDGYGKQTGKCGDTVEMFLCIQNGRIQSVSFDTDGCINTNACANTVAHFSEGKTIEEALKITPEAVIEFLETLPEDNHHCAELAVGVFLSGLGQLSGTPTQRMEEAVSKEMVTVQGFWICGSEVHGLQIHFTTGIQKLRIIF